MELTGFLLFGLIAIAIATNEPVTTPQDYYTNQLHQNQFNPYNTRFYQPNRYNRPGYYNNDYHKYNSGSYFNNDYYNKDYYNKNYYNNEYYQKYNQDAKNAGILRFVNDAQPDGSYKFGFETQNGIAAEQQGVVRIIGDQTAPVVVQGFYRYTSPEGIPVEVRYTADEFGYHPQGNAIPGQGHGLTYKSAVIPEAAAQQK
uniref:Cuticular protein 115 n=1 Tax=Leptinotarsa decemlineata TaxID=7539 RepID=A0A3Q8HNU2_LEPDE|nr:cuticular protein 115 [Leptinotarsa decemlineata]